MLGKTLERTMAVLTVVPLLLQPDASRMPVALMF
jgi:hypothetical protein